MWSVYHSSDFFLEFIYLKRLAVCVCFCFFICLQDDICSLLSYSNKLITKANEGNKVSRFAPAFQFVVNTIVHFFFRLTIFFIFLGPILTWCLYLPKGQVHINIKADHLLIQLWIYKINKYILTEMSLFWLAIIRSERQGKFGRTVWLSFITQYRQSDQIQHSLCFYSKALIPSPNDLSWKIIWLIALAVSCLYCSTLLCAAN